PQTENCYSCHSDHGAVDTTFVQFYPTLMPIAKEKGTLDAGYKKEAGNR
ncbi:MAG TPA: cytochrome P460, partial [Acidobacteriaceae bacterium]|nr:cytochrome P460 [Acidobacteriaceae bacterium]